jgi:hypothetical protein
MRVLVSTWLALCLLATSVHAAETATVERLDGSSAEAFLESRVALEQHMSLEQRLAFNMKLAQIRSAMSEKDGAHIDDSGFAKALDGKTIDDINTMAAGTPSSITIDIEPHDDT